ncbi:hypothetical protein BDB01DRAFT_835966 [Pilobolus umbonatus]|nr:hypothetical protein BDB01DRAFT_835966 [Pilobolus umbonatus]
MPRKTALHKRNAAIAAISVERIRAARQDSAIEVNDLTACDSRVAHFNTVENWESLEISEEGLRLINDADLVTFDEVLQKETVNGILKYKVTQGGSKRSMTYIGNSKTTK